MKNKLILFIYLAIGIVFNPIDAQNQELNSKREGNNIISIGDVQLQLEVYYDSSFIESNIQFHDQNIEIFESIPWTVQMNGKTYIPDGNKVEATIIASGLNVEFSGEIKEFKWKLTYEVMDLGRILKTFSIVAKKDIEVELITLWNANTSLEPYVSRTNLQDIAAFYRKGSSGFFTSLDFPYSKIIVDEKKTKVFYPPFVKLKKDESYTAHTITLGATKVTGKERFGFFEGEVAAMDNYIQERYKPRFDRPMYVAASINNLFTQPKDEVIFYTMKDQPTLRYNIDLVKEELRLLPEFGIEYYQVFPGVFDWVSGDPDPNTVNDLMNYADSQGVRMGDYSGTNSVFCPHFNHDRNSLDKPEWLLTSKEGEPNAGFCFGVSDFVNFYKNKVVENSEEFNFEMHCLDFLNIQMCYNESHGHPIGEYSIYHQVKGLVQILEGINSVSAEMMTWSNSGNWVEFLPKIAWINPNLYLTDPYIDLPFQGLNMTRLLDDERRKQMFDLHYSHFLPFRFMTNYQYFLSRNSIVPDIRNYKFGALSTLAVTPNLGLGEVRQWINNQSEENKAEIIAFYDRWTTFIKNNFDLWKKTYHVGDDPGIESVEIYSHAQDNRGYIFVVNSSYSDRTVEVPMNERLGFNGQMSCELVELYPNDLKRLTSQGPFFKLGTVLPIHVPAREVLVLQVRPAPDDISEPLLYGVSGSIENSNEGYLLKTSGMQGQKEKIAILLPKESEYISSAIVKNDFPKQPLRQSYPTHLELLGKNELKNGHSGYLMEVKFRREPVPTELRNWEIKSESLEVGLEAGFEHGLSQEGLIRKKFPLLTSTKAFKHLPLNNEALDSLKLGVLANFRGAYIENAFGEIQDTRIEFTTIGEEKVLPSIKLSSSEDFEELCDIPQLAFDGSKNWWFQTDFELPFMYTMGAEPFFDEHTFLVLPLLRPNDVKEVRAWINGVPIDIRKYKYPRNRSLSTFYADLIGTSAKGGMNKLVLYLKY